MIMDKKPLLFFYPALVISLCAAFQFYKYVLQVYPSIITDQLMQEYQLNGAGLGNLAATFYYTFMVAQLFVGILLDKFGTRFIASAAIFCCALGVWLFASTHSLLAAWGGRALIGVGVAFSTVTYMKLAAIWFSAKRYAFISGLLATATMAGAVFGEIPLSYFIHHFGWRNCLQVLGFAGLGLSFLFVLLIRDNNQQQATLVKATFKDILQVVKAKKNRLLALYGGLAFSPIAVFGGLWGNPFLQQAYHLSQSQAAYMVSLIFIGLGIGSPIIGILAAKVDDKCSLMFYATLIASAAIGLVLYCPLSIMLLGTCLFIFGFALGAFLLSFSLGKELNSLATTATVIAMINAGDAVLTAISEPGIGKLLDLGWDGQLINGVPYFSLHNYHMALSVLPLYLIVASLIVLKVKNTIKRESSYSLTYLKEIKTF